MKRFAKIAFTIFLYSLGGIFLLLIAFVLSLQLPAVQQFIADQATTFISSKTHTKVSIQRLYVDFPKSLVVEGLFAEDLGHDTLIHLKSLEGEIDLLDLLDRKLTVHKVAVQGLNATISRTQEEGKFNFGFLMDAFSDPGAAVEKKNPDSPKTAFGIRVDQIHLQDIKLVYDDALTGMYAKARVGELSLSMDELDLEKMRFKGNELLLSNSMGVFEIRKLVPRKSDTSTHSILPELALKVLKINSVNFKYQHIPDSSLFDIALGKVQIEPKEIDLNKQWIDLKNVELGRSDIQISMVQKPTTKEKVMSESGSKNDWKVAVAKVNFEQNQFSYNLSTIPAKKSGIDYNHLIAKEISLVANRLYYSPALIKGRIDSLTLKEHCGLDLRQLRTNFEYDSVHASLSDLFLVTPNTQISNRLFVGYKSISSIGKEVGNLELKANLEGTKISMADVLRFVPDLAKQPIINRNRNQTISLGGSISGKLKDLLAKNLSIGAAQNTRIVVDGRLKGLPDPKKMNGDFVLKELTTSRNDLQQLLPKTMLPTAVRIPDYLSLTGKAKGGLNKADFTFDLKSSDGQANGNGSYSNLNSVPHYKTNLKTQEFNIGRILKQNPQLGRITSSVQVSGQSFDPKQIVADVSGKIEKVELKGYAYHKIDFSAQANKEKYSANVSVADSNLVLNLDGSASLRKDSSFAKLNLELLNANLQKLKLIEEDLQASTHFVADLHNPGQKSMSGTVGIKDLRVSQDGQLIAIDSVMAEAKYVNGRNLLLVKSDVLDLNYDGSIGLEETVPAIQNYLAVHLGKPLVKPPSDSGEFICLMEVKPHPVFTSGFIPGLKKFTGLSIQSAFDNREQTLSFDAKSELVQYGDNTLNDILLEVDGGANKIEFISSIQHFQQGNISLPKTTLSGTIENQNIAFGLTVSHPDSGDRLKVDGIVNQEKPNETTIRLTGNSMTIDNQKWKIDEQNQIRITPAGINLSAIGIALEQQFIKANSVNSQPNAPIDIQFGHFELGTLSRIIEKDTALIRGMVNGEVHLKNLSPFAFTSDLSITHIAFREIPIGDLQINADNLTDNHYTAQLALTGDSNDIRLKGFYQNEKVNLDLDVRHLRMKSLEAFASDYIRNTSGFLSGQMKIAGKATEPKLDGSILFSNAGVNLVAINNQVLLRNETIRVDNHGVYFTDFTLLDPEMQPLVLNGAVKSSNFKDLKFELDMSSENFRFLNTTQEDNPSYFGTIFLKSLVKIRGDQNLPIVTANIKLLDGSTFTYVVQKGELSTSRGEDLVVFEDSTRIGLKPLGDSGQIKSKFRGIDLSASIEVNKKSIFRIVVDPESGDNLQVSGDANLAFGIDQSGKMSLSGAYELSDGNYKATFQKVMKREFFIQPGSRISWSGDPMAGQINLTAIYKLKTNAVDLMSQEIAGLSESEQAAYKKLLNYEVKLNVNGPVLNPELSFLLDMPQEDQLAFAGAVYAKINLINTNPNEVNKQVFSLLVLNKFLPTGVGATASNTNVATTIARNSVNQILTDQLNTLSGSYIKGAQLNFNLQTTDDYSGGTTHSNTALEVGLKKELFNSRLSIQVGSSIDVSGTNQNTSNSNGQALTGNMLVEYKVTRDGRYRLKAFRDNQYEGIIDGMLVKTGIGFLYTLDYNHFRELFRAPKKEENVPTQKK